MDPKPPSAAQKTHHEAKVKIQYVWAILLGRVYELMPRVCPKCDGEMKIIAFVKDKTSIDQILNHLELPTEAPPLAPARGPPLDYDQVELEFDETFDEPPEDNIDQSVTW